MADTLTLDRLKEAVAGRAAAFRCRRKLQPAGGPGTKIFPPTYAGATYAVELRRINGESVPCVLIDSVQSQANRMEEALQQAVDDGRFRLPLIVVDFDDANKNLRQRIDRITSLTVPHRLADAILRDSQLAKDGTPFSASVHAESWRHARIRNAWPIYNLCPTGLLFGLWGSPDKPGGLGAKFERAIVSEIVGINTHVGVAVGSRIDPLGIEITAGPLYEAKTGTYPRWTLDEKEAAQEGKKPILYDEGGASGRPGNPSKANHGNVTPSFRKYGKGVEGPDVLADPDVSVTYRLSTKDGSFDNRQSFTSARPPARQGAVGPGGVTADHYEQTITLSLICLRRLRFPINGEHSPQRDIAAQTVLASLGLCAAALGSEEQLGLRSRCLLWPEESDSPARWELLAKPGKSPDSFNLDGDSSVELLNAAVAEAEKVGVTWHADPIELVPSAPLAELVARSQVQVQDAEGASE